MTMAAMSNPRYYRPQPPLPMAPPPAKAPIMTILTSIIVGAICFYMGNIVGMSSGMHHGSKGASLELEALKQDRDRLNRGG